MNQLFQNIPHIMDIVAICLRALTVLYSCTLTALTFLTTLATSSNGLSNLSLTYLNTTLTTSIASDPNSSYYGVLAVLFMMLYFVFAFVKLIIFELMFSVFVFILIWTACFSLHSYLFNAEIKKTQ
ncbi:hypothetical protein BMW23_0748 [Bodo saltans virus]|uniref:Transmembrane protein n=1 Tax=Bodo saltans virus TaxID=2024608 RepID=A0A2H4UVA2_9VIRU|nr:hypothetical protein QJ851_gp0731 [Bodo saltans virus]ATZ80794.1 hypothetical protein BMW23_0748 [Bodo saltans virus]